MNEEIADKEKDQRGNLIFKFHQLQMAPQSNKLVHDIVTMFQLSYSYFFFKRTNRLNDSFCWRVEEKGRTFHLFYPRQIDRNKKGPSGLRK